MVKKIVAGLLVLLTASCGSSGNKMILRLGHNHTETNPSHQALLQFASEVKEKTDGAIEIMIYPNGILGDDRSMIEQTQQGIIDFVRANSAMIENFDRQYAAFSMPYLFDSDEQFKKAIDSPTMHSIYEHSAQTAGLRGLTYQDCGVRNFYLKSGPIYSPKDLEGKKIRVLSSQNAIEMIKLFGAIPTPVPYGEVYTALQQGVVDGAENNAQALTLDKHGEVVKYYSRDGHLRLPDFLLISEKTFNKLTPEQQEIIITAARHSTDYHNQLWQEADKIALEEAQGKMGVQVNEVDQDPFKEKVRIMYDNLKNKDPELYAITTEFQQY